MDGILVRDVPLRVWTMWEQWCINPKDLQTVLMCVSNSQVKLIFSLQAAIRLLLKLTPTITMASLGEYFANIPSSNCIQLGRLILEYTQPPVLAVHPSPLIRTVPQALWDKWARMDPGSEFLQFATEALLNHQIPTQAYTLESIVTLIRAEAPEALLYEFAEYIRCQHTFESLMLSRSMIEYRPTII